LSANQARHGPELLEAAGMVEAAESVLALAGELERTRQWRAYDRARTIMRTLGDLLYDQER
jgi:hypothetical protein